MLVSFPFLTLICDVRDLSMLNFKKFKQWYSDYNQAWFLEQIRNHLEISLNFEFSKLVQKPNFLVYQWIMHE